MDFKQIKELIKLVDDSNISEFKIKDGEFNLSIRTAHYNSQAGADRPQAAYVQPIIQGPASTPQPAATSTPAQSQSAPKAESGGASAAASDDDSKYMEFKSPMIGTFYRKPGPEDDVFCKVGDSVKSGDVVCIIEAMKLFNEIEFEGEGTIVKFLVEDSQPVEYDQPLFLYEPA
jgi:acetyl-CoA carboxylase biotin carboxyl carrier protein